MQATQKIFIGFVAFCATLGAAIGILIYVSMVPFHDIIGKVAAGVIITALVCAAIYIAVRTLSEAGIYIAKLLQAWQSRRMVVHGDVAAYLKDDGTFEHLSAQHVAAGVPRMLPAPKDEEPQTTMPDETIIDLYRDGNTLEGIMNIAKSMGAGEDVKYNRVQRVVKQAKAEGKVPY